ncbi:Hypothetical predicted protein [Mytilus galloprovincialis]|uniref:Reverse transcriptase domain-containing protein n=1 Tax=Mytilus galloprovincialis TaxID=29158 RepID=A0A8B6H874_MYTGA|nr:Hypothetical predicted protein [Mytilus galloprovincialis]
MDGTRLKNTWIVRWPTIKKMLVICVLLFPGLLVKEVPSRTVNQNLPIVVPEKENSILGVFFVALAKSVIPSSPKQASQKVTSVSIVTSPGTLQGTAPKKGFLQRQLVQQSSRNRTQERPSNKTDTDIDEVEYCFQFVNKYEKKSGQNLINVKGNLRKHALFWKNVLNANDFIMNVINFGYRIPFLSEPPTIFLSNNRSALKHSEFVENSIEELLTKECIKEVNRPFVVNPLTVSVNSTGKERLVLDLRHVNKFVEKQKVKFEGVKEAMTFVNFSGFGFKFDLKSGYHHIEIHPDHQKYLGFSWQYGDTVRYFTFSVLPFGLSSAGHIFTKTVRVLVKYWRSLGFPMVVYLDDGMGTAENFDTCFELSKTVKNDLLLSGFIANTEKSVWEPVQNIDWLGFVWNFKDCTLEISLKKLFALKLVISSVVDGKTILTYRCIAKICGKIISMIPALGNVCQMMTKHMHMLVCCRSAWDDVIPINDNILKELKFWYFECESLSFQRIVPINRIPQRVIFTDASQYAGAGFIMNDNKIVHFMFDGHERSKSSTWRELKTVEKNISSFKSDLTGKFVKLYTDNQNVVQIVKKGSMKVELQDIALSLFHICLSHNIFLDVEWIPRDKNTYADYLSKIF